MEFLYQQPFASTLSDMLGASTFQGLWGMNHPWHQSRCHRRVFRHHQPQFLLGLFGEPATEEQPCKRRCQAQGKAESPRVQPKCYRPKIWKEDVDISHLNPETVEVRFADGKMVISGTDEQAQQWTKCVELPTGLISASMRCFVEGNKLHLFGLEKSEKVNAAKKSHRQTPEKVEDAQPDEAKVEDSSAADQNARDTEADKNRVENKEVVVDNEDCSIPAETEQTDDLKLADPVLEPEPEESPADDAGSMDFEILPAPTDCCCPKDDDKEDDEEKFLEGEDEASLEEDTSVMDAEATPTSVAVPEGSCTPDDSCTARIAQPPASSEVVEPKKPFCQRFDLNGFDPAEMKVKLTGRQVTVTAEHREETEDSMSFRQYCQSVTLPDDVILSQVTSRLNDEGVLEISGHVAVEDSEEKELAIEFQ